MLFSSPLELGSRLTSGFGSRWGTLHAGTDYGGPVPGSTRRPVYSVAAGKILRVGRGNGKANATGVPYHSGLYIWQDLGSIGGDRMRVYYGHLDEYLVRAGASVKVGQLIGYTGGSGASGPNDFVPHLHFGVAQNHDRPVKAAAGPYAPGWINADVWLRSKGITVGRTTPRTLNATPVVTTPKEDTLSAAEVAELKTHFLTHLRVELNAAEARIKDEVKAEILAAERRTKAHTDNSAVAVEARTTGRLAGVEQIAAQAAEAAGREPDWAKVREVAAEATSTALGEAASAGFDLTLNVSPKESK